MIVDFFGRAVQVDDVIAYPQRQGSNLWMETGKVLAVEAEKLSIRKSNGRKTKIRNVRLCIVAPPDWTMPVVVRD